MILHMCGRDEWPPQDEYRPESLEVEGFVHCSDLGTVHLPANQLFSGRTDLVLLVIDPARLDAPVRWERPVVGPPDGPWFPHVYGPINPGAVIDVIDFPPGPDGVFTLPAVLANP
ncbi:DUF952 domain-containing protein [Kibdelosporangium persicum]|nr:DUF952 domain-containing protein [Kibdelosporangium persicum]